MDQHPEPGTAHRISPDAMIGGNGGTGGPGGDTPTPKPAPTKPAPLPPFQPASYTFRLMNMTITETRSAGNDSDKVSFSVAVSGQTPTTQTKNMGDCNNGTFPINLSIGPVTVNDPAAGVAMNYLIVNSCNSDVAGTQRAMGQQSQNMTIKGVSSIVGGVSQLVGSIINDVALPTLGPIVNLISHDLQTMLGGFFSANCDGPVAAEQPMFTGQQLWVNTINGPYTVTTKHPGIDSNWGCGANSVYTVSWSITRS